MSLDDLEFMVQRISANSISVGDLETLVHFCKGLNSVVELGTNTGSTAMVLSMIAKVVYTVDVFENIHLIDDEDQRRAYQNSFYCNQHSYGKINEKLRQFGVNVLQGLSYELAAKFNRDSVDAVFIDADHSRKGVARDYEAWFDKVKPGGVFIFHDVVSTFPVYGFFEEELLYDKRIEIQHFEPIGKWSTKVFRKK